MEHNPEESIVYTLTDEVRLVADYGPGYSDPKTPFVEHLYTLEALQEDGTWKQLDRWGRDYTDAVAPTTERAAMRTLAESHDLWLSPFM